MRIGWNSLQFIVQFDQIRSLSVIQLVPFSLGVFVGKEANDFVRGAAAILVPFLVASDGRAEGGQTLEEGIARLDRLIVVGGMFVLLLSLVGLIVFFIRRRERKSSG